MRDSGYNWMKTNVDTISGNRPHLLGCVFKCLLSLMPFFPHLSHRSPLSQFLMCLSVGIMKKKKTGFDNPLLLQSPKKRTSFALLTHFLWTCSQPLRILSETPAKAIIIL